HPARCRVPRYRHPLLDRQGTRSARVRARGAVARWRAPRGPVGARRRRPRPGDGGVMGDLANQVAVVTGASSGIGAATARELARRGVCVVLAARRGERLQAEEQAIVAAGGRAVSIPTDLADREQLRQLVERANSTFGRIDVLVNNAGAYWMRSV